MLFTMRPPRAPSRGEIFLPFGEGQAAKPATHWRTTWTISSIQTLKERGHFERYKTLLPKEHADEILMTVAGLWMPIAVARVHYKACDDMKLPKDELVTMGRISGHRAQGTVLKTAVTLAKGGGATPWTAFANMQRLWERGADGGGVAVYKVGPKEAVTETMGCELLDIAYFRIAYSSVCISVVEMFSPKVYVQDITAPGASSMCTLRFQWV
jgi:hypothetical protein